MIAPVTRMLARIGGAARHRWDVVVIVLLAAWILWPVPFEVPRSQDHTVHLARAWIVGQNLAGGHVADWSSMWFFGFPAGELYPVVGDVAVSTVRGLSLWSLPWDECYALVFWLAYVLAALALVRTARVCGWGPWPGVVAAALFLLDPGETREGGFRFTVFFGVWLLPLAVTWTWCALAELHAVVDRDRLDARSLLRPAGWTTLALLAHPITAPLLAVLLVPLVLLRPRRQWIRTAVLATSTIALAAASAAWFLLPMAAHRAWMANFGALHHELARMVADVADGAWSSHMAPAVGWTISAGVIWALWRGDRFARIVAVGALLTWLLASREAFWIPRLDRFSAGFGAMQYQRFVMCAKPGLFLCAGVVATALGRAAWTRRAEVRTRMTVAVAVATVCAAAIGLGWATIRHALDRELGTIQLARGADPATAARFEADWREYLAWAKAQWDQRDGFHRFAYRTLSRHGHGFTDAPVFTGAPAYKVGSTPGETFVHRVEDDRPAVLDRLRVRYLVTSADPEGRRRPPGREVRQFGTIHVYERAPAGAVARIVGDGTLDVVRDEGEGDSIIVEVHGTTATSRLEFAIAGYPRWELLHDGTPVEWYEVPVLGDHPPATQASRRAGALVSGSADRTEPTEPMLLAADAADGRWELRYRNLLAVDAIGFALTALAAAAALGLRRHGPSIGTWLDRGAARLHPAVVAIVLAAPCIPVAIRWLAQRRAEADQASAWIERGVATDVEGMRACPIEIERVIRPAVCIDAGASDATATFPGVSVQAEPLHGFVAIEDGSRARGQATVEISARPAGGEWTPVWREPFRLNRRRLPIEIALPFPVGTAVDLRLATVDAQGDPGPIAFDLTL